MEKKSYNSIYFISFFEGAAVMATELCGSKLISPYFGSSLYVWASVIAVSLGSLAAGYYYGGKLSSRENKRSTLVIVLLLAAVYMGLMPLLSNLFGTLAMHATLLTATVISSFILLFLPMFLMGAASPMIIGMQTTDTCESGKVSGTVYSISTIGGIASTFLSGFYFIPTLGINNTLIVFASLLVLSLFVLSQKKSVFNIVVALIVLTVFGFTNRTPTKNSIYQKDGMLGQLNVIDDTVRESNSIKIVRKLLVNNVVQTEMDLNTMQSVSQYIRILDSNTIQNTNGKALVLGLGGGLTSNVFTKKGYKVLGVELDERIIYIANKYFFMNERVKGICDDARHFINGDSLTYDIILMDLFKAEEQPVHVVTAESFIKIKQMLNPGGQLIINWHGYLQGDRGLGTSVLLNTLKTCGYSYKLTAVTDNEDERNIVIFASLNAPFAKIFEIKETAQNIDMVNTDNCPLLEKYNVLANQSWRKNYILYYYSSN